MAQDMLWIFDYRTENSKIPYGFYHAFVFLPNLKPVVSDVEPSATKNLGSSGSSVGNTIPVTPSTPFVQTLEGRTEGFSAES